MRWRRRRLIWQTCWWLNLTKPGELTCGFGLEMSLKLGENEDQVNSEDSNRQRIHRLIQSRKRPDAGDVRLVVGMFSAHVTSLSTPKPERDVRTNLLPTYHEPRSPVGIQGRLGQHQSIDLGDLDPRTWPGLQGYTRAFPRLRSCAVWLCVMLQTARHEGLIGHREGCCEWFGLLNETREANCISLQNQSEPRVLKLKERIHWKLLELSD